MDYARYIVYVISCNPDNYLWKTHPAKWEKGGSEAFRVVHFKILSLKCTVFMWSV